MNSLPNSGQNSTWFGWMARLVVGLLLIVFLLQRGETTHLTKVLSSISPFVLFWAIVFMWLAQALSAARWHLLLKAKETSLSYFEAVRFYWLGMFCNLFLPTTIGGDGVRAVVAGPRCGGITVAASSILVERLTGLVALLTIGATGVALWGTESSLNDVLPRIFAVLSLATIGFLALRFTAYRLEKTLGANAHRMSKAIQKWAALHRETDFYMARERRGTLALALALSFVFQSAQMGINIYLARAAGLQTPLVTFLWLVPLLSLMSLVPIGIGGLGVRETAAIAVLGSQEPNGAILAWSLLYQATIWLASLPGGLFLGEWRRSRS
ncbi:MAG TPA: lysylphosphatidylglycerol synthase transmembrane domain-containing protein [Abditibacteriaceae bacterium]|jgi:hypothetical protein